MSISGIRGLFRSAKIEHMLKKELAAHLEMALETRSHLLDTENRATLRLFTEFYEGASELVVDLYGHTIVLFDYGDSSREGAATLEKAQVFTSHTFPGSSA